MLLKGVGEPLARLVRERCQVKNLQVELRRFSENNWDLLHKSNTPGYLFASSCVAPWALITGACIYQYLELRLWASSPFWLLLPVIPAVAGPALLGWILKRTHQFLRVLAHLEKSREILALPSKLAHRYRAALGVVRSPALRGTLRALFERALVIFGAAQNVPSHVRALLEGPRASALELAQHGIELAEAAQTAQDRRALAREAELIAELESLRARLQADPRDGGELEPLIEVKQEALRQVEVLEQVQVTVTQKLLRVAAALELAATRVLVAGLPVEAAFLFSWSGCSSKLPLPRTRRGRSPRSIAPRRWLPG